MRKFILFTSFIFVLSSCSTIELYQYLSFSDIKKQIASAKSGDTVVIPAGLCVIDSSLEINKNIIIKGAGIDKTIFKSNKPNMNVLTFMTDNSTPVRVSGITFKGNSGGVDDTSVMLRLNGYTQQFRIDHCKFTQAGTASVVIYGIIYGVIDHCLFIDDSTVSIDVYGSDWNTDDRGQSAWDAAEPIPMSGGNNHAVFVEDNSFIGNNGVKGGCSIASNMGSRYVFRRNYVYTSRNYVSSDAHGKRGNNRGSYCYEIYDNTYVVSPRSYYNIYIRGGRGVIFNNTITGNAELPICLAEYGCFEDWPQVPTTDKINNLYIWNNTYNGALFSDNGIPGNSGSYTSPNYYVQERGTERSNIRNGVDYFDYDPGFIPYDYYHPLTISLNN